MNRRELITLLGGAAAAWPIAARAQSSPQRRVGVLMNGPATDAELQSHLAAFVHGLRQLGWVEGQNLHVDIRWPPGDASLAQIYAAQLNRADAGRDLGRDYCQSGGRPASHQHGPGRFRAGL